MREVIDRHGERVGVKTDLRVGEVIVVEQHQRGLGRADELGHLGAHTIHIELHLVGAHERAIEQVIQADRQSVGADGRVVGCRRLDDGERGDDSGGTRFDVWCQSVDASGFEPERGPSAKVPAARDLKLCEQVAELGVAVCMFREVGGDAGEEGVDSHPRNELLEHRSALGVGDAVEVHLHGLEILDGRDHGMGRGQLVLAVGPALLHGLERGPGFGPLRGLGRRDSGRPFGEGLIQPEVVPPFHGDEVAEPHVGEFVQDRDDAALFDRVGHL